MVVGLLKVAVLFVSSEASQSARDAASLTVATCWPGLQVQPALLTLSVPTAVPLSEKVCTSVPHVVNDSKVIESMGPKGWAATTGARPISAPFSVVGVPEMMSCGTSGLAVTQGTVAVTGSVGCWAAASAGKSVRPAATRLRRRIN